MAKSKNVLFLLSSSELYGSGRIILQVLRLYKREGFNPIVLVTGPGQLIPIMEAEGITVYIQNLGILRRKYVSPSGLLNRLGKNLGAYRYLNELHSSITLYRSIPTPWQSSWEPTGLKETRSLTPGTSTRSC